MKRPNAVADGLKFLLNQSATSPSNPDGRKAMNELITASGLPTSEVLKHIGRKTKAPRVSDQEKQEKRLSNLEHSEK
jgi:hypothetical protein